MTAAGQVTAAAVLLLPLSMVVDRPWLLPLPTWEVWGAIAGLAVIDGRLPRLLRRGFLKSR